MWHDFYIFYKKLPVPVPWTWTYNFCKVVQQYTEGMVTSIMSV